MPEKLIQLGVYLVISGGFLILLFLLLDRDRDGCYWCGGDADTLCPVPGCPEHICGNCIIAIGRCGKHALRRSTSRPTAPPRPQ